MHLPEVTHTITENGDVKFNITGLSNEDFCMLINATRRTHTEYSDHFVKNGTPCAGRTNTADVMAYLNHLIELRALLSKELSDGNMDAYQYDS
jgi:hypothetical protein